MGSQIANHGELLAFFEQDIRNQPIEGMVVFAVLRWHLFIIAELMLLSWTAGLVFRALAGRGVHKGRL